MRIALVLLFLLYGVGVFANSQPPTPTPSKTINKHEKHSDQNQNNPSAEYQIGTETAPFVVKIQSPVAYHPEANKPEEKHNDYTSPEWGLVYLTFFLVLVTFGLTIYTARLWKATKDLAKDAKDTADRQAAEMQESLSISKDAVSATKESVDLARKEFNATHRPQIIIHTFERKYYEDSALFGVIFTYVNIGTAPASIVEIGHNIFYSDNIAADDTNEAVRFDNKFLEAGERDTCLIKSSITDNTAWINHSKKVRGQSDQRIICKGRIRYVDSQGIPRETGFCRVYTEDREWQCVENSEYEYSY